MATIGRPRSAATRAAILAAALAELTDRGYSGTTIEGIAARAGAGKQTIYRWWPSKADVLLDAMLAEASLLVPTPDTGTLDGDLAEFLSATFRERGLRPVLSALMAQAVIDPQFGDQFRHRFIAARRAALRSLFERALARGELRPGVDIEFLLDVVFGVLWYRLLVGHAPLDDRVADQLGNLVGGIVRATPG